MNRTPPTAAPPAIAPTPPADAADDRRHTARPLAAWLAIVGAALVLLAATVVVAGRWQVLSTELRCAVLAAGVVMVFIAADRLRPTTPVTAAVVGHLAPLLVAPAAVAAAASLHQSWRVCVLTAGIAAAAAAEWQRRRWPLPFLVGGTAAAVSLGLAGAAALTHVPVALLVGAAAVVLMGCRARVHALTLAVIAAAGPVLAVLAGAKVGAGTLTELGATGGSLPWAAPAAGALSAAVMGVEAHRTCSRTWAGATLAALALGSLTGLAGGATAATLWCTVPAVLLVALEVLGMLSADGPWRKFAAPLPTMRSLLAVAALAVSAVVLLLPGRFVGQEWVLPAGLTALAMLCSVLRTFRTVPRVADTTALAAVVTAAASLTLAGVSSLAAAGLLCAVSFGSWVRRIQAPVTAGGCAGLAIVVLALAGGKLEWHGVPLVAAISICCMALVGTLPRRLLDDSVATVLALVLPTVAGAIALNDRAGGVLAFIAAATVLSFRMPMRATQLAVAAAAVSALGEATAMTSAASFFAVSAATYVWCRGLAARHLGSVEAVLAVVATAVALDVAQVPTAAALLLSAVALTGLGYTTGRLTVLDSLAVSASAAASILAANQFHSLASLAVVVIGSQLALYGITHHVEALRNSGAALVVGGTASLWWTTSANAWAVRQLQPIGMRESDLMALLAGMVLLALGAIVMRRAALRSYVALGPGLLLLSAALLLAQQRPDGEWAAVGALATGVIWVAVGAWQRFGAVLLAGTIMLAVTVTVSSGDRLAALPGWVWLLFGGLTLVALAAAVERSADGEHGGVRDLARRLR